MPDTKLCQALVIGDGVKSQFPPSPISDKDEKERKKDFYHDISVTIKVLHISFNTDTLGIG